MTYEYLLAGLPELKAGSDAPISLEKLDELFDEQLRASDKALLDLLRAPMNEETLEQGLKAKNRFIRDWFGFNQDMNNVLVAQICRKHGFDVKTQIVGEGEVAEQLRTHTSQKDFGLNELPGDYQPILALAQIDDLMQREKAQDANGSKNAQSLISSRPRWSARITSKPSCSIAGLSSPSKKAKKSSVIL